MKHAKRFAMVAVTAMALHAAHAANTTVPEGMLVSYVYTGNPFTNSTDERWEYGSAPTPIRSPVRLGFRVPDYLPVGQTSTVPYNDRWKHPYGQVVVNDEGEITAWNLVYFSGDRGGATYREGSMFNLGSAGFGVGELDANIQSRTDGVDFFSSLYGSYSWSLDRYDDGSTSFNVNSPGHWTVSLVPGSVPEPETYAMTLIGLLMVGGMLKRRARRAGKA